MTDPEEYEYGWKDPRLNPRFASERIQRVMARMPKNSTIGDLGKALMEDEDPVLFKPSVSKFSTWLECGVWAATGLILVGMSVWWFAL